MAYNLLKGKRGIIFGALNELSIAWKVAERAVEEGAEISDSIVMQRGYISKGAKLSYVITDKNVNVAENRTLSGTETYPIVIAKDKNV